MSQFEPFTLQETPPVERGWIHSHPYGLTIAGVFVLLIAGFVVVVQHLAVAPNTPKTSVWGNGLETLFNPTAYPPSQPPINPADYMRLTQNDTSNAYVIPKLTVATNTQTYINTNNAFDFNAFIALLSHPSTQTGKTSEQNQADIQSAYAFIPQGLISTTTPVKKPSKTQQDLYNYGNDAGSSIQTFEDTHPNQARILKDQVEDREDPDKNGAVIQLGHDFVTLGQRLESVESVPTSALAAHTALAKSYQELGKNLALIPTARMTPDLLNAITTYNTSADTFAKNFVALATIFSSYGVSFAPTEGGSVFMFSDGGGL